MNKRQVAMLIGLVLAAGFALTNFHLTHVWFNSSSDPGWIEAHAGNRTIVLKTNSEDPASVLQYGDELVSVNDRPVEPGFSTYRFFERVKPGTEYRLQVNRNGEPLDLLLRTSNFSALFSIGILLSTAVVPATFIFAGFLLILFGQGEKRISLLATALALTVPEVPLFTLAAAPLWAKAIMILGRPLSLLAFPLYFKFLLTFPEKSPLLKKFGFLNRGIYLYGPYFILGFCGSILVSILAAFAPERVFSLRSSFPGYLVRYGVILVYVPAILSSIVWSVKRANQGMVQRARVIAKGALYGFGLTATRALFMFLLPLLPLAWQSKVPFWTQDLLVVLAFGTLPFMPAFFIYALARRQLIPINIAMRRAAEYTATYMTFAAGYLLVTVVLSYLLAKLLTRLDVPLIWSTVLFVPLLTIPIWSFSKLFDSKVIAPHVKRRSLQLSYDLRQAWPDLITQLRNVVKTARLKLPIMRVDQSAVDEVRRALRETLDIQEITSSVCRIIQSTWIADNAAILLEERTSGDYFCSAYQSLSNLKMTRAEMAQLRLPKDASLVREMQNTQHLMFDPGALISSWAKDLVEGTFVIERQTLRRLRPALFIPILVEDQMIGILSLGPRTEELSYNNQDRETLVTIARETGKAIDFARLKIIAGSPDLPLALENVIKSTAVPAQKGSIYLWNEDEQALVINAQYGFSDEIIREVRLQKGEGFAGLVFQDQQPLVVDDVQTDQRGVNVGQHQIAGIQSSLYVPLVAWGRAIGVLCLDNMEKKSAFKRQHLERVMGVASFASIVVQNAILQEELRNLGSKINRPQLNINNIFTVIFNSIRRVTDVRAAHLVLLLDPYMPELSVKQEPLLCLAQGFLDAEKYRMKIKPCKNGLGYRVLQEKKAITGDSFQDWAGAAHEHEASQTRACICLPLEVSKYVGGLLYLHYCSEHEFTHAETITLKFIAEQAALAISNARQQEELRYTNKVVWMSLMMSNIRHEIRQYTDGIRTNLHALNNRLKDRLDEVKYLTRMKADLDEIRDLQARSLPTVSKKKVVEIGQFLCREVQRWCKRDNLDCSGVEKRSSYVYIDENQFSLVIKNLTINAVRAMQDAHTKRLTISSEIVGQRINVRMSNTGKPISPALQETLFSDVIQGNGGGNQRTGVGLFIGRRIVRFHDGDLGLVKSDDTETIFSFWLPILEARSIQLAEETIGNGAV
ncbi:MAG: GAF domain-containing protein [Acidobacteriota bacterium]